MFYGWNRTPIIGGVSNQFKEIENFFISSQRSQVGCNQPEKICSFASFSLSNCASGASPGFRRLKLMLRFNLTSPRGECLASNLWADVHSNANSTLRSQYFCLSFGRQHTNKDQTSTLTRWNEGKGNLWIVCGKHIERTVKIPQQWNDQDLVFHQASIVEIDLQISPPRNLGDLSQLMCQIILSMIHTFKTSGFFRRCLEHRNRSRLRVKSLLTASIISWKSNNLFGSDRSYIAKGGAIYT